MKVISFDIGIKNLAYCIFSKEGDTLSIEDWNVLNLMDQETPDINCTCSTLSKTKPNKPKSKITADIPSVNVPCTRKAEWKKGDQYFCKIHAKHFPYLIPKKEFSANSLKKKTIENLQVLAKKYEVDFSAILGKVTKKIILDKMDAFFQEKCFEPLIQTPTKTAGETDLITIGRNMKILLNAVPNIASITHVIMENQISTLATRMKTIQGMLAQYFIMTHSDTIHIEFVSSMNKLKGLPSKTPPEIKNVVIPNKKTTYKQHKTDGVFYTRLFIENNIWLVKWKDILETKKKDDLADCFLQCVWWLKHNNIITYADNLKINNV